MNRLLKHTHKLYFSAILFIYTNEIFARSIEQVLRRLAQKGQKLLFLALPIFVLVIAYQYKKGEGQAKERMEKLVIGGVLAATAFSISSYFDK